MRVANSVRYAIDDGEAGKFDAALLHACIAIDSTSKALFPREKRVGVRYVKCLRQYYWVIEPMLAAGINLHETKFENVPLRNQVSPDLAEIIYEVFRCGHVHGDQVPDAFRVIPTSGPFNSQWVIGKGELHLPDRLVWALVAVSVFSSVNEREKTQDMADYQLSLGTHVFRIADWWGKEQQFRPIAELHNQVRVTMRELGRFESDSTGNQVGRIQIVQPYPDPSVTGYPGDHQSRK